MEAELKRLTLSKTVYMVSIKRWIEAFFGDSTEVLNFNLISYSMQDLVF